MVSYDPARTARTALLCIEHRIPSCGRPSSRYLVSTACENITPRRPAMHRKTFFIACVLTGFACISAPVRADVKPHGLFTDNMVLQRGTKAAIWGTANDGEKIAVEFRDRKGETTAK